MADSKLVNLEMYTPHADTGRGGQKVQAIVVHHMAAELTAYECGKVFQNRYASAHYGIGSDGRIGQYVRESNTAWACGNRSWNQRTISIECANDGGAPNWHVADLTIKKCVQLVADICIRHGIKQVVFTGDLSGNLIMHRYIVSTACPGPYLAGKFRYIADEVNKILRATGTGADMKEYKKYKALRNVNVYKDHSIRSGKVGTIKKGEIVTGTDWHRDDWVKIAEVKNWVPIKGSLGTYLEPVPKLVYTVTNPGGVNIYPDPEHKRKMIKNVKKGSQLTATKWVGNQAYFPSVGGYGAVSCLTVGNRREVFLKILDRIGKEMAQAGYRYNKHGCAVTYAKSKANKITDCAHYVSYAMQQEGLIKYGKCFWLDTTIHGTAAEEIKTSPILTVTYPRKLWKNIALQPGDIVGYGYSTGQHTQVYAGKDKFGYPLFMTGGTLDVNGGDFGPKRKPWYEKEPIDVLIRIKV